MGRLIFLGLLAGLGLWAFSASARGSDVKSLSEFALTTPVPPVVVTPPAARSTRTGSTRGPIVVGGGPSSGK